MTTLPPLSLPQMSDKISETGETPQKNAQTFENDSILEVPKVAKKLLVPVGRNVYRFRFVDENIKLARMPKILGRINFDTLPIRFRRCREFCIKMRVATESQMYLLVLESAEIPQNFLDAWIFAKHH